MNTPNLAHVAVAEHSTGDNQRRYNILETILEVLTAPMTVTEINAAIGNTLWNKDHPGWAVPANYAPGGYDFRPTVQRTTQHIRKLVAVGAVKREEIKTGEIRIVEIAPGVMKSFEVKEIRFSRI